MRTHALNHKHNVMLSVKKKIDLLTKWASARG